MLRITPERLAHGRICLHLEGRVVGPWIAELACSSREVRDSGRHLSLDMAGVSFLDAAAVGFVRQLLTERVSVTDCSPFVSELLHGRSRDAAKDS